MTLYELRARDLAAEISGLMLKANLKPATLAKRAGMSHQGVANILAGKDWRGTPSRPKPETLQRLATALATDGLGTVDEAQVVELRRRFMAIMGYIPAEPADIQTRLQHAAERSSISVEEFDELLRETGQIGTVFIEDFSAELKRRPSAGDRRRIVLQLINALDVLRREMPPVSEPEAESSRENSSANS